MIKIDCPEWMKGCKLYKEIGECDSCIKVDGMIKSVLGDLYTPLGERDDSLRSTKTEEKE